MADEVKPEEKPQKRFDPGWYRYTRDQYKPIRKKISERLQRKYKRLGLEVDSPQFRVARKDEAKAILEQQRRGEIDPVTGLPNRNGLERRLKGEVDRAKRGETRLVIFFLDVNDLKKANEISHERGDELLRSVANVLTIEARPSDIVGRWGGDEFLVILPSTDIEGAKKYWERKIELFKNKSVWISAGLSEVDLNDIQNSINKADNAMRLAKKLAKQDPSMPNILQIAQDTSTISPA